MTRHKIGAGTDRRGQTGIRISFRPSKPVTITGYNLPWSVTGQIEEVLLVTA